MKCLVRLLVLALAGLGTIYSQQSTQVFADILEERGIIGHSDRARIRAASADDAVRFLASILREKGLIDGNDLARAGVTDVATDVARPVELIKTAAAAPAPAPKAAPQTTAEASPMTALSRVPIRVYGTLLMNSFLNTSLNNLQDIPLFAGKQGSDPTGGDKNFGMTVRQSRVGMRYMGTRIGNAKLSGQVEFDFFGGQSALANGVGFDIVRLRLAVGRLDWKNLSLVAGQDWSVFAPLNPTSLATYAIPGMSSSGNLWIRSPQVRAEYRHDWSDNTHVLFQLAATDPNVGDNPTTFATVRTAGIGERGRLPGADSRVLITEGAVAIGVSGHYSRGKNAGMVGTLNVQNGVDSWGAATDYTIPINKHLNFTGEAYQGRALGIFSSAAGEAVLAPGTPGHHGVESRGGWSQAQVNWNAQWQTNLAYGIDSINARQLPVGNRNKTQTYTANTMYKWSPSVTVALEWRRFLTNFRNQPAGNEQGDHVNLAIAFTF